MAELLIALAILAVIATFTIPKVLTAQADAQKKAIFKEDFATISAIIQDGALQGGLSTTDNSQWFKDHLNAYKWCDVGNAVAGGCWGAVQAYPAGQNTGHSAAVLHNGSQILGFDTVMNDAPSGVTILWLAIDYNGQTGPNAAGDDQLHIGVCLSGNGGGNTVGKGFGCGGYLSGSYISRTLSIGCRSDNGAANITLFGDIFK